MLYSIIILVDYTVFLSVVIKMNDKLHTLSELKYSFEDSDFEIDIEAFDKNDELNSINERMDRINAELDYLDDKNWKYVNHCDKWDYSVAIGSGIVAGIVDSIFAGVSHIDDSFKMGSKVVDKTVLRFAHKNGYSGNSLNEAIAHLEKKFPMASDSLTPDFGGGLQHHLRDFSHHASPMGLLFSLILQFSGFAYGTDTVGNLIKVPLANDTLVGKNFLEKIMFGTKNWFMHLVSDMAGSSSAVTKGNFGTGIPGPLLSLAKTMSSSKFFKKLDANGNKELSVYISKLFNGTLTKVDLDGKRYVPFDLRTEIGQAIKHASIIVINEVIVRTFYFIRRFYLEIKDKKITSIKQLNKIEPMKVLPFKNKTIVRMLTVSYAVIETIDIADAAIRAAASSGGNGYCFLANFVIRINFVGIGRLAVAVGSEVAYSLKSNSLAGKRMNLINEYLLLNNAKVFYKQSDMWKSAYDCGEAIIETENIAKKSLIYLSDIVDENDKAIKSITDKIDKAEENNPGLKKSIKDIMGW